MATKFKKPVPAELREEFHRLCDERDRIRAEAQPFRDAYEAKRLELAERERVELAPLTKAMQEVETPLYDLEKDIAQVLHWLKVPGEAFAFTGPRPVSEE